MADERIDRQKKISIRDISRVSYLIKAMHFIYKKLKMNEIDTGLLYQFVIAGEITITPGPQNALSMDAYQLLPKSLCQVLQEIRDALAHCDCSLMLNEKQILNAFQLHQEDFRYVSNFLNGILIYEAKKLIYEKFQVIQNLPSQKFSKTRNTFKEIQTIKEILENLLNLEKESSNLVSHGKLENDVSVENETGTTLDKFDQALIWLINQINEALNSGESASNNMEKLKNSSEYTMHMKNLAALQKLIDSENTKEKKRTFFSSIKSTIEFFSKEDKQPLSSPQIEAEKKQKLTAIMRTRCSDLKYLLTTFESFSETDLKASQKDQIILSIQYKIRWELIIMKAVLEKLGYRSTRLFKDTRNFVVHQFDRIDAVKEREELKIIYNEDLSPFHTSDVISTNSEVINRSSEKNEPPAKRFKSS